MDSLVKADIFFFVTTIAIILLTIGGCIIIVYVWRIARDIKEVSEVIKVQTHKVSDDIEGIRKNGTVGIWNGIIKLGSGIFKRRKKKHHEKKN